MKKILILIRQPGLLEYFLPFIKKNSLLKKNNIIILTTKKNIKLILKNKIRVYKIFDINLNIKNIINFIIYNWKPNIILMGANYVKNYKEFYDYFLVSSAKKNNIKLIQCIEASYDYMDRLKQTNQIKIFPNKLLVLNKISKREAVRGGIYKNIIEVTGHPGWENIKPKNNFNFTNIVFINQPINYEFGAGLGFSENDVWEMVYSCFQKNKEKFDNLFWCPHPRDNRYIDLDKFKGVKIASSLDNDVRQAGIVVGMFSNFLINSYLSGKKVISVTLEDKNKKYISPLVKWGCINHVTNQKELEIELNNKKNKRHPEILQKEFQNSLKRLECVLK